MRQISNGIVTLLAAALLAGGLARVFVRALAFAIGTRPSGKGARNHPRPSLERT